MTEVKPTATELATARDRTVPDVIAPGLRVLFCGINPGLYSGATGLHFARPGNRFWPALHRSGFTPRLLMPVEQQALLECGLGITNIVERTTAKASDLDDDEIRAGGERLARKAERWNPAFVAVCGLSAFRVAFGDRAAEVGPQERTLGGARLWLLPNPSGLNAHYQIDDLARVFGELKVAALD